jgi:hypothetical protein
MFEITRVSDAPASRASPSVMINFCPETATVEPSFPETSPGKPKTGYSPNQSNLHLAAAATACSVVKFKA